MSNYTKKSSILDRLSKCVLNVPHGSVYVNGWLWTAV